MLRYAAQCCAMRRGALIKIQSSGFCLLLHFKNLPEPRPPGTCPSPHRRVAAGCNAGDALAPLQGLAKSMTLVS